MTPAQARAAFRSGTASTTEGLAPGFTQANLVVLSTADSYDFLLFAQRNPKPCPILDVTETGEPHTILAPDADLRTDLPRYRVWEHGELVDEPTEISSLWRQDLVAFLIGCSFTFEAALRDAGVPLRHLEQGHTVPMYRTNSETRPAGRFKGPMVVSMRPVPATHVATAVQVTARVPAVHGAPVHIGAPDLLGIGDLDQPDYGHRVDPHPGDIPVFWACGVTPQAVLTESKIPFAITHAPGHMFLTDIPETVYRTGG